MSVPAVLIRKSTKQIIKHAPYPKADLTPFAEGEIDPDYEWLIGYTPFAEPPYDANIFIMKDIFPIGDELLTCPQHPEYPGIKAYTYTFEPIKRPDEDIIRAIENAAKDANNMVFSEAVHKDEIVLMMNSVHKDAKGELLTPEEQATIDKLAIVTVNLAKNAGTKDIKIAQVIDGQVPNIEAGWEKSI